MLPEPITNNNFIHYFSFREGRGNAHLTGNYKRIGDVVLHNFDSVTTEYYLRYVDTHGLILEKLERVLSDPNASPGHFRFAQVFRDFESQKVCYLPITTLILKPLHRILHYELLLDFISNNCICQKSFPFDNRKSGTKLK